MARNTKKIRREIEINGQKRWVTADTEQEYASKLMALSKASAPMEKHNFTEYADRWFYGMCKPNVAEVTAINYRRPLMLHILPVLGDQMVEDIDAFAVQQVFNRLDQNTKQETKNKIRIVLNQIFKMAVEEDLIRKNPMESNTLKTKGLPSTVTEPYSVEEMQFFVSHLEDIAKPYDRAWLALCCCLPLRPEEVLGLQWADIDEDSLTIHVRNTVTHPDRNQPVFHTYTKTMLSNRTLAIPQRVIDLLPERERDYDFVIGGGQLFSYSQVRRLCTRIAKAIGYTGLITPRRFRTTVATDISSITHDLKLVQHMLGHANPQMTLKHYDKGRNTAVDGSGAIEKCYGF